MSGPYRRQSVVAASNTAECAANCCFLLLLLLLLAMVMMRDFDVAAPCKTITTSKRAISFHLQLCRRGARFKHFEANTPVFVSTYKAFKTRGAI
jgi:hypothetical protein